MTSCLLLIDVQNGFVSKATEHVISRIMSLDCGRFDHVVASRFVNAEGSPYRRVMGWEKLSSPPETDLIPFVEEAVERVFVKNVYTMANREFLDYLDCCGIDVVYLCGIDTDCCVLKTAVDLFELDRDVRVLEHYCASNGGPESHEAALRVMGRQISENCIIRGELLDS